MFPALAGRILNHWTTRESLSFPFYFGKCHHAPIPEHQKSSICSCTFPARACLPSSGTMCPGCWETSISSSGEEQRELLGRLFRGTIKLTHFWWPRLPPGSSHTPVILSAESTSHAGGRGPSSTHLQITSWAPVVIDDWSHCLHLESSLFILEW